MKEVIIPVGKRLVVEMLPKEKMINGILIPGNDSAPQNRFKVLTVSDELKEKYKNGEILIIDTYAGSPTDPADTERKVRIIKEDDVWAKITEKE